MGTVMVANASAFAPNLQKGLIAAEQIITLIERKPKIQDPKSLKNDTWVTTLHIYIIEHTIILYINFLMT